MSRKYDYIQKYEEEILKLKDEGITQREIGERLDFSKKQIQN